MRILQSAAIRRARTAVVTTLAAGAGAASLLGMAGTAHAGNYGWVTTTSCTGVAGSVHYSPGLLTSTRRSVHATLTGTTSGCSDIFSGAWSGTGTITALLSGKSSVKSENFTGTFTVNWPASSGFNPSNGNLTVTQSNGIELVSGTITSGFDTGSVMQFQYVVTGKTGRGTVAHPVTAQTYTNTQPLTLSRNEG